MQRKLIKIGGEYGVIARAVNKNREQNAVKATVTALDAKYEKRVGTVWSRYVNEMNDGIEVVFDEDVVQQYDRFKLVSDFPAAYTPGDDVIKAGTRVVLESPKMVVGDWAPIAEMKARWAAEADEEKSWADKQGDIAEPLIVAVNAALDEKGIEYRCNERESRGKNGYRQIDARYGFDLDEVAKLLGVSVAAS